MTDRQEKPPKPAGYERTLRIGEKIAIPADSEIEIVPKRLHRSQVRVRVTPKEKS